MEVISFGQQNQKPPLLFIHGSYCGAWVWTRFFLPAFAQAGWWGAAISLRGHGKSAGLEQINSFGIGDYLEDIAEGTRLFDQPAILIGHSLGGYLAQKYALENPVKGQILLSSPSLLGLQGSVRHIAMRNPMLAVQLGSLMAMGPRRTNLKVIRDALFNDKASGKKFESQLSQLQPESSRVFMEANWPDFRHPVTTVPTLALGGDADAFIPEFEYRYEASFWHGKSKVLHGVSHGVMMDACWPDVAKEMLGWLGGTFGSPASA